MPEPLWGRLGTADREQIQSNEQYLARLYQVLQTQYDQGLITADSADALMAQWEESLGVKGWGPWRGAADIPPEAPFYKQLVAGGNIGAETYIITQQRAVKRYQEGQLKETTQREATAREYLPQLNAYLQSAKKKGQVTQSQLDTILKGEASRIAQGIDPKLSPNYQAIQDFFTAQREAPARKLAKGVSDLTTQKLIESQREQKQFWAKRGQQQQAQAIAGGLEGRGIPMARQAQLWEETRKQALAQIPEEYGWIRRWELEHQVSPYERSEAEDIQGEIARIQAELGKWGNIERGYPEWAEVARGAQEYARENLAMWQAQAGELGAPSGAMRAQPQLTPPTPAWLAPLTAGLRAGEPLRKEVAPITPSPQQWMRLLPSQRERYAGFTKWAGQSYQDIMSQMELTMPKTPVGAGRTRWTPSRQRVSV